MHRISVHPSGLAASAAITGRLSGDLADLTARAAAAAPELLASAFGPIGADFSAAYAAAHATHLGALAELSAAFAGIGTASDEAASAFVTQDAAYAAAVRATGTELRA
ncbi:type VII secretion target [Nocardia yunnanensis]|nr:type VII secretion target [Nocardia yunnanensis]